MLLTASGRVGGKVVDSDIRSTEEHLTVQLFLTDGCVIGCIHLIAGGKQVGMFLPPGRSTKQRGRFRPTRTTPSYQSSCLDTHGTSRTGG